MLYDPFDEQTRADPYDAYRRLRDATPVWRHPRAQMWFVSGHAASAAVLRDERFSAARAHDVRRRGSALPPSMLTSDPPEHTRLRRAVAGAFAPARMTLLEGRAAARSDELAAGFEARGTLDAVADYARPIAVDALCGLLGVPDGEQERFAALAAEVAPNLDPMRPPPERAGTALTELLRWFAELLGERMAAPTEDVFGTLVAAWAGGELEPREALNTCGLIVVGGLEPLVDLIAMTLWLGLREGGPEGVRLDAGGVGALVEEALRYDAPIHFAARVGLEDAEVGGCPIPAGEPVVVLLGAANRDPQRFAEPDRFVADRRPNPHLSFGAGAHVCLGGALARTVARVAVDAVARLRLVLGVPRAPTWRDGFVPRGLATLPLEVLRDGA